MSDAVAMQFVPPNSPEDQRRADLYGLMARLFYAPPDANLLSELRLAAAPAADAEPLIAEGKALAAAWAKLVEACVGAFPAQLEEEHLQLFVGVGKAQVTPYLCAYMERTDAENPLARLRGQLAQWGLARREETVEPEDHVAALCETMRWLIEGRKAGLEAQRAFFRGYLFSPGLRFCSAVSACEDAGFYRHVAGLLQSFLDVELKAFDIE
jgi:TorA maturation chaperone TorD